MLESHRQEIAKLEALYAGNPGGRVFVHLAEALRKAGEHERARSILDEGLARHPDSASGYVVLGRVLVDMGSPEQAESAFRRVLELDTGNLVALRNLGDLARSGGRTGEAIEHYRELVARNPSSADEPEIRQAFELEAGGDAVDAAAYEADAVGSSESESETVARAGPGRAERTTGPEPEYGMIEPAELPGDLAAVSGAASDFAGTPEPEPVALSDDIVELLESSAAPLELEDFTAGLATAPIELNYLSAAELESPPAAESGSAEAEEVPSSDAAALAASPVDDEAHELIDIALAEDASLDLTDLLATDDLPAAEQVEPLDLSDLAHETMEPLSAAAELTLVSDIEPEPEEAPSADLELESRQSSVDAAELTLPDESVAALEAGDVVSGYVETAPDSFEGADPTLATDVERDEEYTDVGLDDVDFDEDDTDVGIDGVDFDEDDTDVGLREGRPETDETYATGGDELLGTGAVAAPLDAGGVSPYEDVATESADPYDGLGATGDVASMEPLTRDVDFAAETESANVAADARFAEAALAESEPAEPEIGLGADEPALDDQSIFAERFAEAEPADMEVGAAAAEAEPALSEVEPALADVKPALAEAEPALADVEPALADVEPALAEAEPAYAGAESTIGALEVETEGRAAAFAEPEASAQWEPAANEPDAALAAPEPAAEPESAYAAAVPQPSVPAEADEAGADVGTETLADLYLAQGFAQRAAQIYRSLLRARPDDERLAAKLRGAEGPQPGRAAAEDEPGEVWLRGVESAWTGGAGAAGGERTPYAWTEREEREQGVAISAYLRALISWTGTPAQQPAEPAAQPAAERAAEHAAPEPSAELAADTVPPEPAVEPTVPESAPREPMPWEQESAREPRPEPWAIVADEADAVLESRSVEPGPESGKEPWSMTPEPVLEEEWHAPDAPGPWLEDVEPPGDPWLAEEPAAVRSAGPPAADPGSKDPVVDAFDEWFGADDAGSAAAPAAAAERAPEPAGPVLHELPAGEAAGDEDDEDLEMFRAWLKSLKK